MFQGALQIFTCPQKPVGMAHESVCLIGTGPLSGVRCQITGGHIPVSEKDCDACNGWGYPGVGYDERSNRKMDLGFKEKTVVKKLLKKIQGTDLEKLLQAYHVI